MKLPYKIYSYDTYWEYRARLRKLKFSFRKFRFKIKDGRSKEVEKWDQWLNIVKVTFWASARAVFTTLFLVLLEYYSTKLWFENITIIPDWIQQIQLIIPKPFYPENRDVVIEMISVIASISGVILALFYPVLATIASTAYAKVHSGVRNLLLSEKQTQGYMRRLTFLTASALTVLLLMSFNFLPGNLILMYIVSLSLTSLFLILNIGLGVYQFLEPSTLATISFNRLHEIVINVTTKGKNWNDKTFQNYYHKEANRQLENLSQLLTLTISKDLNESSFRSMVQSCFYILQNYLFQKPKIPIDSSWFPTLYEHPSFFTSDMTKRELSGNTSTFLMPDSKLNLFWFEEKVIEIISDGWSSVVERKHYKSLDQTMHLSYGVIGRLGSKGDFKNGEILLISMKSIIAQIGLLSKDEYAGVNEYDKWKYELASVQTFCYAIMRFQIEFFEAIENLTSDKILNDLSKIDWHKPETLYNNEFPPDLYHTLNKFREKVLNEEYVEGKIITPSWYLEQLLVAEYRGNLDKKLNQVVSLIGTILQPVIDELHKNKLALLSTYTAHVGLEILSKLNYRLNNVLTILSDLDTLEKCKGEFRWTTPDIGSLQKEIEAYESSCFQVITENILELSIITWTNQYPDVFGQSYAALLRKLNEILSLNNSQSYKKYFPNFLGAALAAFDKLNEKYKSYQRPQDISYQVLIDAMEISGYSLIYAKIHGNEELWNTTINVWDKVFEPSDKNINLFAIYHNYYRNSLHGTGINFHEKHIRERTLSDVLERMDFEIPIKTRDPILWLVGLFIRDTTYVSLYDVSEMFLELYILSFINSKESSALSRRREIYNQMLRFEHNMEQDDDRED